MLCIFCLREELSRCDGKLRRYKLQKGVTSLVCSACIQIFLQMPQDKLIEARRLAIEKGYLDKASWLESFIDKEKVNVRETGKTRPNLVRERLMRKARPSRYKIRA